MQEQIENKGNEEIQGGTPAIFRTLIESKLIEGAARGDNSSQKAFYARFSSLIMGLCCRYSSGKKDALSMCVFVFRELFKELKSIQKDSELIKWIRYRTIWNAVKYLHQDRHTFFIAKTTKYEENKTVYGNADESQLSAEMRKEIYLTALQSLTPSYRILFNLTYIDEIPTKDILSGLQMAAETYKAELEQARFQFKLKLNECNHEYKRSRG